MICIYYLYNNGNLIATVPFPNALDPKFFGSSFVKHLWMIDTENRANVWKFITEALGKGAKIDRIKEILDRWKLTKELTQEDLKKYIKNQKISKEQIRGIDIFITKILKLNVVKFWDDIRR